VLANKDNNLKRKLFFPQEIQNTNSERDDPTRLGGGSFRYIKKRKKKGKKKNIR